MNKADASAARRLDSCLLCEHIRGHLIGTRASLAKDQEGRRIALPVSRRTPAAEALSMPDGHKIPVCLECAKYVQEWIRVRMQAHMQRQRPAGDKILIANEAMARQAVASFEQLRTAVTRAGGRG
jgi:hypothetical protein